MAAEGGAGEAGDSRGKTLWDGGKRVIVFCTIITTKKRSEKVVVELWPMMLS